MRQFLLILCRIQLLSTSMLTYKGPSTAVSTHNLANGRSCLGDRITAFYLPWIRSAAPRSSHLYYLQRDCRKSELQQQQLVVCNTKSRVVTTIDVAADCAGLNASASRIVQCLRLICRSTLSGPLWEAARGTPSLHDSSSGSIGRRPAGQPI